MSETQAQAILDLRLHRLTGLEQEKIIEEFDALLGRIRGLLEILVNPDRLREVVREELLEVKEQFATPRRTEIELHREGMDILHLIKPQDRRGHDVALRLREVAAARRLLRAAPGRARQDRGDDEAGGFRRAALRREHARHGAVLLQPRQGLLGPGLRAAAGGAYRPRQADGEHPAARGG